MAGDLNARIAELELLLQEANETLDAIRNGEVDAIVVGGQTGQFVYTLENADRPYRVLVEQMKEGALTLNESGLILYANNSFSELIGHPVSALIGSPAFDFIEESGVVRDILMGGEPASVEIRLKTATGVKPVSMSIVELEVESGAPSMFSCIVTDLTEMRRTEAAMRQAQKMDAIGQLTGGIAHDFNNLLMAISSSLGMLQKRIPDDPQIRKLINNAQEGAKRGAALTQRMLAFARRQDLAQERIDVGSLTREILDLMQRTLGPEWPIDLQCAEELPVVMADRNQLEMALLNLVVNARDAMPDGGEIRISSEPLLISPDNPHGLREGKYVRLRVVDEGEGMDAETLQRATEPFFTTKGLGKGTGLGLSMVHGLAKQLGGTFVLKSSPGVGTSACLWLPAIDGEETPSLPPSPQASSAGSVRAKILAVDDDVLIRMNVVAMLEDLGHEVLEASSGDQALSVLREIPGIELLITDQAMPSMTGTELIKHVAQDRPALPVILATGYGELPTGAELRVVKLSKPFNQDELAEAIERALN